MPHYSKKHKAKKKLNSYKNNIKHKQIPMLNSVLSNFSSRSTYKFYAGPMGKSTEIKNLKSRKQAKKRSFTLALRAILPALVGINNVTKLDKSTRDDLHRLLTSNCSHIKRCASDSELRVNLTYQFIDHLTAFMKTKRNDVDTKFNLLTFSCESWFSTYERPEFDLHRAKESVTKILRDHLDCNALGVFEIQPLHNKTSGEQGGNHILMLHCHVLVWGKDINEKELSELKEKASKRIQNKMLKDPLHRKRVNESQNDILRLSSYLPKLPISGKRWDKDLALVKSESQLSRKHLLRLFQILSQFPVKTLIFSVGKEAVQLKRDIWKDLSAWDVANRKQRRKDILTQQTQRVLWERLWKKLEPTYSEAPVIRYSRGRVK